MPKRSNHPLPSLAVTAAVLFVFTGLPDRVAAQEGSTSPAAAPVASTLEVLHACYVPSTGTVYRIKEPGLSRECVGPRTGPSQHVEFSWTEGVPDHLHGNLNGLGSDDHPQYLRTDGTRALTGDLSAGGNGITDLGAATAPGQAVPFEQAVKSGEAAAGDLGGAYPDPTVVGLQGHPVSAGAPNTGEVLTWDGSSWSGAAAGGFDLNDLLVVDGAGSGIDADLLDGRHASSFASASHDHDARYVQKFDAITSPNGAYSLSVTDAGIELTGPSGLIRIDANGVQVESSGASPVVVQTASGSTLTLGLAAILSATGVEISSSTVLDLKGALLKLNGGCEPNARRGDAVVGPAGSGTIATGSSTVFSC